MKLRDYQQNLVDTIHRYWSIGKINICVQLATGGGKTLIMSEIIKGHMGESIIIAHRGEILSQISLSLAKNGIVHNIIAQKQNVREMIKIHLFELNKSFYSPISKICIASVDTLIKLPSWEIPKATLVIQDEAHHVLKDNKWGRAASMFPEAKGLYLTATPLRADGNGLGRHADGIIDILVSGKPMHELINEKYLAKYRVFVPPSDLDLSEVTISASGDYSLPKLNKAIQKSKIVGDVVGHYLKIANGKSGITFTASLDCAAQIAQEFREANVSAEVISGKTPDLLRADLIRKFKNKELLQLINVDLLGEGVDVPAVEVISMARPTCSYAVYAQQFGRALRPMVGKERAIIIDHVGNVYRHGLPDQDRKWSLDRKEKISSKSTLSLVRTCSDPSCLAVYDRFLKTCPYCNRPFIPTARMSPLEVNGDLFELDESTLDSLRKNISRIDGVAYVPKHLDGFAQRAVIKRHNKRQEAQRQLREQIALYAGYKRLITDEDSLIYKMFYEDFEIDIGTAQTLGTIQANILEEKIKKVIDITVTKG